MLTFLKKKTDFRKRQQQTNIKTQSEDLEEQCSYTVADWKQEEGQIIVIAPVTFKEVSKLIIISSCKFNCIYMFN